MLKRIAVLALVGLVAGFAWSADARANFEDVPLDHWAYDAVEYLADEGLVIGYPDGTFRGDRMLTRYEFAMVVSRLYDQFLAMMDDMDEPPPIDVEAIIDMLWDEFEPEINELMQLVSSNAERIDALEGTVGGFDDRIAEIGDRVDAMDRAFHPYGDLSLRFYGIYPEDGMQTQRPQFMLHFGFISQVTDELTFGARFSSGAEGSSQSAWDTMDDAFGEDPFQIDRAYMMWTPASYPGFTMLAGKFAPPWVTTPMTWDTDVQVEGLAQHYNWNDFDFYLGEMVPTVEGFYFLAQAGVSDLFLEDSHLAVTYHYINDEAFQHIRADMMSGALPSNWDFSRLESPDDYRAFEVYWEWMHEVANIPFQVRANYLMNLEDTAPGLSDEAGWQQAAWASLCVHDLSLRERGDWNVWGEWARLQPNSVLSWTTDAWRGRGDAEYWVAGYKYRLMRNTDITLAYLHRETLALPAEEMQSVLVIVTTKFQ